MIVRPKIKGTVMQKAASLKRKDMERKNRKIQISKEEDKIKE